MEFNTTFAFDPEANAQQQQHDSTQETVDAGNHHHIHQIVSVKITD